MGMEWGSLVGRGSVGVNGHESGMAPSMTPASSPPSPTVLSVWDNHLGSLTASQTSGSSDTGEPAVDGGVDRV